MTVQRVWENKFVLGIETPNCLGQICRRRKTMKVMMKVDVDPTLGDEDIAVVTNSYT
jgi:hypothetical protein